MKLKLEEMKGQSTHETSWMDTAKLRDGVKQ